MKCIGVNQWTGTDSFMAEAISDLEQWAKHSARREQERFSRMVPSEKFLWLVNERFEKLRIFGIVPAEGYWRIGDWGVAEIRKISLDDAKESEKYLIHLQSVYVVDAARGSGEGTRVVQQLKQIADECGCGLTLFARPFAFSQDGHLLNAFQTFEELTKASLEERWPIIYLPEWQAACLQFFYERCGFRNMCLYDSWVYARPKEADLPFDSQFAYLPTSMDPCWRKQIEHRLNRELCEFCNR
jgi:GNAT superfamily N-acetyltransferase